MVSSHFGQLHGRRDILFRWQLLLWKQQYCLLQLQQGQLGDILWESWHDTFSTRLTPRVLL